MRGRGRSQGHPRGESHADNQLPTLEVDYGFLGDRESVATDMPMLCGRERQTKVVWSSPVPAKGVEDHPHGSNRLKEWIEETGFRRLIIKSDQEPSIVALINAVKNAWSGELVVEAAPKENHERSNGGAEVTVQQVHGLARTLKEQLEDNAKIQLPVKHPVLAWLVEYVGLLLTIFPRGADGFTPWFRLKGKQWRVPLPLFGEVVEFRLQTRHKAETRWSPGIYLGIRRRTTEKLVGTPKSIYVVQSVRRKPLDEAWDGALLLAIKGTPWQPTPKEGSSTELPLPIVLAPEVPEVETGPTEVFSREAVHRNIYITKRVLEDPKIGYTAGCPACDGTRLGMRKTGVSHTAQCRNRIEMAMATSGDPTHRARVQKWLDDETRFHSSCATAAQEIPADGVASQPAAGGSSSSASGQVRPPRDVELQPGGGIDIGPRPAQKRVGLHRPESEPPESRIRSSTRAEKRRADHSPDSHRAENTGDQGDPPGRKSNEVRRLASWQSCLQPCLRCKVANSY